MLPQLDNPGVSTRYSVVRSAPCITLAEAFYTSCDHMCVHHVVLCPVCLSPIDRCIVVSLVVVQVRSKLPRLCPVYLLPPSNDISVNQWSKMTARVMPCMSHNIDMSRKNMHVCMHTSLLP